MSSNKVMVYVKVVGSSSSKVKKLNLDSNLSEIRKELEKYKTIDDILLFSTKCDENEFSEIEREEEENFFLNEIIEELDSGKKFLYLSKNSGPCWKILNEKRKLDYGHTLSFDGIKKANKRAFTMKDCEFKLIGSEEYKKGQLEFGTKEDWIKKTNLFFSTDINVQNFIELGISIGGSRSENFNDEINSIYTYTEIGKASLKLNKNDLEVNAEFKKEVIEVIESESEVPRKFKKIIEDYGQFIPTEVTFGGRVYFKDVKVSSENSVEKSKEGSASIISGPVNAKIGYNSSDLRGILKSHSVKDMRLLGGKHPEDEIFDEKAWVESLENYQNWDCIEFKDPISIFQLLSDDLRKKAFESIGKRILYTTILDYNYYLYEPGIHGTFELRNIPLNISDIILNEDADCNIFAAVVDTEEDSKNVFFNCQVLCPPNGKPSLIIHGIQKKFKDHKYKLRIGIMVIGYDTDFNFILSDINVKLIKKEYNSQSQCKFDSIPLQLEHDLITKNVPFLGIPVLRNLDPSIVIGHNFSKFDNELKIDTFSYCSKTNRYVNLPKFTFCTLIIYCPLSNSHKLIVDFKSKKLNFNEEFSNANPKYISLYLREFNNYIPIFLNQKSKQVSIEHVCEDCSICKTLKNIECIFFDPADK